MEKQGLQDSPSFVDLCTLHQHAMRYYRLWIYACNTVLALATLVFTVFAVSVLVDPRISLLSGVELYQPTFLYAYVALLLQCGVLQTIGCLGALRLNQKLLNTYWTLLLVLMIGDIIVGLVWAFRLDFIRNSLKPSLKNRLSVDYGKDPDFTQVWDWVQSHDMCCGVDGPADFFPQPSPSKNDESTASPPPIKLLPSSCCTLFSMSNASQGANAHLRRSSSPDSKQRHLQSNFQVNPNVMNSPSSSSASSVNLNNVNAHTRRRISSSTRRHYESKTDPGGGGGGVVGTGGGGGGGIGMRNEQQILGGHNINQQMSTMPQSKLSQMSTQQQHHQLLLLHQQTTTESSSQSTLPGMQTMCELPPHILATLTASSSTSSNSNDNNNNSNNNNNANTNSHHHHHSAMNNPHTIHNNNNNNNLKSSHSTKYNADSSNNNVIKMQHSEETLSKGHFFDSNSVVISSSSTPTPLLLVPSTSSGTVMSTSSSPTLSSSSSSSSPSSSTFSSFASLLEQKKLTSQEHTIGCADKILEWLDHVTDVLFVIGFCIIVFLKGCFVAILRYEIKEMIVKIRLIETNGDSAIHSQAMNELIGLTNYDAQNDSQGENGDGNPTSDTDFIGDSCKRHSGSGGCGGNLTSHQLVSDSSHHHHVGNHVGHHHHHHTSKDCSSSMQQAGGNNGIEDDFDSSSALLGRLDNRTGRGEGGDKNPTVSSGPRTLPKNGNNNVRSVPPLSTSASLASSVP